MQEASVIRHHRFGFGIAFAGKQPSFSLRSYLATYKYRKSGASPLELDALLLFAFPFVLTLQKLVALVAFADRSHQFTGLIELHPYIYRSLSDAITLDRKSVV